MTLTRSLVALGYALLATGTAMTILAGDHEEAFWMAMAGVCAGAALWEQRERRHAEKAESHARDHP